MEIALREEHIASLIYFVRGEKAMLDSDLARLYGVSTSRLNEQVKRNIKRFPADFMFRLTRSEYQNLISQNATSRWGGRRKLPFAFTEHGSVMLASVLNSTIAVEASIRVVRAFVRLREILNTNKAIAEKIKELEKLTNDRFTDHDEKIQMIFETLHQLMNPPKPKHSRRRKIGFRIGKN